MPASPLRLGAAPHRIMFFAGASNLLLAMVWWAGWLVAARWPGAVAVPYPPVFPGWLHAFVMQYQVLPAFIFGFLLTTFPKWMKQPDVPRHRFIPVGGTLIVGQLVTLAGALGSRDAIGGDPRPPRVRAGAMVAARGEARTPDRAVRRACLAAGGDGPEPRRQRRVRGRRRLPARPRAGARAVHRVLRQRPRRDGDARDPGARRPAPRDGWLVALAPWAAWLGTIYLSPRSDGKPG